MPAGPVPLAARGLPAVLARAGPAARWLTRPRSIADCRGACSLLAPMSASISTYGLRGTVLSGLASDAAECIDLCRGADLVGVGSPQ